MTDYQLVALMAAQIYASANPAIRETSLDEAVSDAAELLRLAKARFPEVRDCLHRWEPYTGGARCKNCGLVDLE